MVSAPNEEYYGLANGLFEKFSKGIIRNVNASLLDSIEVAFLGRSCGKFACVNVM